MKRITISDCLGLIDKEVKLMGFVLTVRAHGKIAFFDLRDRTGVLQIGGFSSELAKQIAKLCQQDVVEVSGVVKKRGEKYVNNASETGSIELDVKEVSVLEKAKALPFDMAGKDLKLQLPTLLDFRSLSLRHKKVSDIFLVQASLLKGFREVSERLGCVEIMVPTIAASSTEGGAEVFSVDYFGHHAFLTQSPQLYKQMLVPVFERVYTIAHAYRAEPSVTTRHIAESVQMDCEFGFVSFSELLTLLEQVATGILKHVEKNCGSILKEYGCSIAWGDIPRLTLREAQEIVFKETGRDNRHEKDLSPQDEVDLWKWAVKTHGSDLVTITHFPTLKRAFYTMPDPKDKEDSLSYDVLFKGVEISSGSQRINEYDTLVEAISQRGMDPQNFTLYLQAFAYGMPSEGGFSFGLERMTWKLLGLENIREATLFPRDMERVDERFSQASQGKKGH